MSTQRRQLLLVAVLLATATAAVYIQTAGFDFTNIDDPAYVTSNPFIQAGLTRQDIAWAFRGTYSANWHPLTWISHMLDIQLYGLRPMGHHMTNVLLHIGCTVLLFLLLNYLTGYLWRSALVAALFGLHPIHAESVAWVAERKDVLSTFFWMLTALAYVWYIRGKDAIAQWHPQSSEQPHRKGKHGKPHHSHTARVRPPAKPALRYALMLGLFGLGLMSKPMLVTLPVTLLLLDYWPLARVGGKRGTWRRLIWEKIPLFAMAAASCLVTFVVQRAGGAVGTVKQYSLVVRLGNAAVAYAEYILKTIWPVRLSVFYPHPGKDLSVWAVVASAALLIVVSVVVLRFARRVPYLAVGWLWYLITLVPVIGIVQVGEQQMADRYAYVPLIGLFIAFAWGVPDLVRRLFCQPDASAELRRAVTGVLATAGVLLCIVVALLGARQVSYWSDGVTLFRHALWATRGHPMLHYLYADALQEAGLNRDAYREFSIAARLKPDEPTGFAGRGYMLAKEKKNKPAEREYRKALKLDPDYFSANCALGDLLMQRNQLKAATRLLRKAVRLQPDHPVAHLTLAVALERQGKYDEAEEQYRIGSRLDPSSAAAYYRLGLMQMHRQDFPAAIESFEKSVKQKSVPAEVYYYFAMAQSRIADVAGAKENLQNALSLKGTWAEAHESLAVILYRSGDYPGAWKEVHLAQRYGSKVNSRLLEMLSAVLADPEPAAGRRKP